jgi:ABC-type Fe3+ transport system substrate-binding protein
MKENLKRRQFLKVSAVGAGIAGIAGCTGGSSGSSGSGAARDKSGSSESSSVVAGGSSSSASGRSERQPAPGASAGLTIGSVTISSSVIKAAQAEGECLLYGAMDEPDMLDPIKPAFEESVPGVKLTPWGGGSSEIASKLIAEFKANIVSSDVTLYSLPTARAAASAGVYVDYTNDHWLKQVASDLGYPAGSWQSPEAPAYEFPCYGLPYTLHYNTELMSEGDAPSTYEEWTGSQYTGQDGFVMQDPRQLSSIGSLFATLWGLWGEDKMRAWAGDFMKIKPQFTTGNTGAYNVCLSGEKALCNTYINDLVGQTAAGESIPMKLKWIDPALSSMVPLHMTASAPHPNAGEAVCAWFMSEVGQEKIADTGRTPAHGPSASAHADFAAFIPSDQVILPYAYNNPVYGGKTYIQEPAAFLPLFEELF